MQYRHMVILLNFTVNCLLFLATNALIGYPFSWKRESLAALIGGIISGACLIPEFSFLGNDIWRCVLLVFMGIIGFGTGGNTLTRGMIFVLLNLALGGLASGREKLGWQELLWYAFGVFLACMLCLRGKVFTKQYAKLQLWYGGKHQEAMALVDTGNILQDPVTAEPVIILGREVAQELTGLAPEELASPLETISAHRIPGLRLIPYRSVGCDTGMLLCLRMDRVTMNGQEYHTLVAFAPNAIENDVYQALLGGNL